MQIAVFIINPLFPDREMGGGPVNVKRVARALAAQGHQVTILCTLHPDSTQPFSLGDGIAVIPCLPFKQPFPAPYAISPHQLAAVAQTLGDYLATADRFYIHDGELLLPYLYQQVPTVIAFQECVYPETLLGSFVGQGDVIVGVSTYTAEVLKAAAGRFFPDYGRRVLAIDNAIDTARFTPAPPSRDLAQTLGIDLDQDMVILHPHRPEPSKGLQQTIEVVDQLVHGQGMDAIRVLVPRWFDVAISAEVQEYYQAMATEIERRQLQDHFVFHGWIPFDRMPDYYRLGRLTLVLGNFVEGFGNVAYESMACGTPAIVARVGPHRSLLPDNLIAKVDYGDTEAASAHATAILGGKEGVSAAALAYLRQHFSLEQQVHAYVDAIVGATKQPPLTYHHRSLTTIPRFVLAPWCHCSTDGQRIYHDFLGHYETLPSLVDLVHAQPQGFGWDAAAAAGLNAKAVTDLVQRGLIVPDATVPILNELA